MRKLIILALTLLSASFAAQDYSGIWNGKGGKQDPKYGVVPQTAQMTILQSGTSFTGTLKIGSSTPMKITSGTISGTQLTFTVVEGKSQITGSLSQNGTQLSGSMTASNGQVFNFVFGQN